MNEPATTTDAKGDFDVYSNAELASVDQLTHLTTIHGRLYVLENPAVSKLEIPLLATLDNDLTVQSNMSLPTCDATTLRDGLMSHGWTGASTISGNLADGCTP